MNYLIVGNSTIYDNVDNANARQDQWARAGRSQVAKHNATSSAQFVHDVAVVKPRLDRLTKDQQSKILSKEFKEILRQECNNVRADKDSTSYCSFYTYILSMVAKKFGKSSVAMDSSNFKFRGFIDDPDVKDYVVKLTDITIDRALYRD